jgi:hypothetical protein
VTDETIEFNLACLDSIEYVLFTYQNSSSCAGFLLMSCSRRAHDTDSRFGLDGVRKSEHVTDDRTVTFCFQTNMDFVFGGSRFATNFESAEISAVEQPEISEIYE